MLFKLAIRNIFRNKRRTLITIGAVAFAVFISSFMRSFQKGAWDNVINTSVNSFVGFAQIHADGYWDDQNLDRSILYNDAIKSIPSKIEGVQGIAPRIESFALASIDDLTHGVMVIGIDPEAENDLIKLEDKISSGAYLTRGDHGAIIAEGVAKKLGVAAGDTLVMISQGYHASNAAGKFPIRGVFKYALPDLNKRLVYLNLPSAQDFYAAPDRLTSVALKIDNSQIVDRIVGELKSNLPEETYEVMSYQELLPELMQARQLDEGGSKIILGILYALIAFAIFGTILMMTKERSYEFGVLTAIGMQRWKLFSVVFWENVIVGLIGALLGILLALPLVYYLHTNPLDMAVMGEEAVAAYEKFGMEPLIPAAFEAGLFINQAAIIFILTCLLGLYPLWKISTLKPVAAMRDI